MSVVFVLFTSLAVVLAPLAGVLVLARYLLGADHAGRSEGGEAATAGLSPLHVWNHAQTWFRARPRRLAGPAPRRSARQGA